MYDMGAFEYFIISLVASNFPTVKEAVSHFVKDTSLEKELERSVLSAGELEEKLAELRAEQEKCEAEAAETRRKLEENQRELEAQRQELNNIRLLYISHYLIKYTVQFNDE